MCDVKTLRADQIQCDHICAALAKARDYQTGSKEFVQAVVDLCTLVSTHAVPVTKKAA